MNTVVSGNGLLDRIQNLVSRVSAKISVLGGSLSKNRYC